MVIQHHKDRGYLENLRLHTLNTPPSQQHGTAETGEQANEEEGTVDFKTSSPGKGDNNEQEDTPSTPSTNDSDEAYHRPVKITTVSLSPTRSQTRISAATIQPSPRMLKQQQQQELAENFETNYFVRLQRKNHGIYAGRRGIHDIHNSDEEYGGQISSGESSEDVFHVDVHTLCSSIGGEDRSKVSASTTASAISDWMKTIRVVPSEDVKTTGTGSTGSHGHSTEPSLDQSSLEQESSLEELSIEQSMAESMTSSSFESDPRKPIRTMEV